MRGRRWCWLRRSRWVGGCALMIPMVCAAVALFGMGIWVALVRGRDGGSSGVDDVACYTKDRRRLCQNSCSGGCTALMRLYGGVRSTLLQRHFVYSSSTSLPLLQSHFLFPTPLPLLHKVLTPRLGFSFQHFLHRRLPVNRGGMVKLLRFVLYLPIGLLPHGVRACGVHQCGVGVTLGAFLDVHA